MTYYLLQSHNSKNYLLLGRDGTIEVFFNEGSWTPAPPIGKQLDLLSSETVAFKNNKLINWWHTKYYVFADATLIYRCKSLESYKKWCNKHPELFI